jgi:antirestriction protein ArdC
MERFFCAALIGAAFFAIGSLAHVEDAGGKHHKVQEWLSLLSEADRAKLRAAKQQALKDAVVQAANQRRKQAEADMIAR